MTSSSSQSLRQPAGIVLVFAIAVLAAFWFHTGLDMYPLDDGWTGFAPGSRHFSWTEFLFSNRREFRQLAFMAAMALEQDGFVAINSILFGINVLTWLGLFVILYHVFRKRTLMAFAASALIMLFPNDPTMFWLGAFGVNISYLLLLWSIAFSCVAIDRNRPWLYVLALVLFFIGIKTYPGFIALPPIVVAYLVVRDRPQRPIRRLLKYLTPQALIIAIAAAPVFVGSAIQRGRDGRVASFDLPLVLKGYGRMLENLTHGWTDEFFHPAGWMLPYALLFCLLVALAMLLLGRIRLSNGRQPAADAGDARSAVLFVGMCLAVIVFGYLPYSVSAIRFNPDRALMGSRIGFICLLVAAGAYAAKRIPGRKGMPFMAMAAGVAMVVLALNKLSVFDERYQRSLYQRVLLSDLAAALPCARSRTPLVIHTAPGVFSPRTGGQVLNLRPELPLRAMYAKNQLRAFTLNNWTLARLTTRIDEKSIRFRRQVIGPDALIFEYSFEEGLRYLPQLTVDAGRSGIATTLTGSPLSPNDCTRTPLMRSLLRDRAGYLQQLGLIR